MGHEPGKLPPATILARDLDHLAFEKMSYSAKLSAAGIPSKLHVYPGGVRGFELGNPEADISIALQKRATLT